MMTRIERGRRLMLIASRLSTAANSLGAALLDHPTARTKEHIDDLAKLLEETVAIVLDEHRSQRSEYPGLPAGQKPRPTHS